MVSMLLQAIGVARPVSQDPPPRVKLRLTPRRGGWINAIDLPELWRHRDLLWFMSLRDISVRYKQTALGALWAIIQPLITMVVFTVFFGRWLGVPNMDDPVFVYAGLLPWLFFAAAVTAGTNSVIVNADMMRKVYFPRLILPIAAMGAPLVDFVIALGVLVCLMAAYAVPLTAQLILAPVLIVLAILAAVGVATLMAALTVAYRDFRHVVPFMLQVWFFLTPVLYPQTIVPQRFRWMSDLNPMTGPIEAFRAAVMGTPIDYAGLAVSTVSTAVILLMGLAYFGRVERRFADIV